MAYARTITWLAILAAITPFLAIPAWLIKVIVGVLAGGIVFFSYQSYANGVPDSQSGPRADNHISSSDDSDESTQSHEAGDNADTDQQHNDDPVDIEDPDADRMVADNRWRRRSSRELSDRSDTDTASTE